MEEKICTGKGKSCIQWEFVILVWNNTILLRKIWYFYFLLDGITQNPFYENINLYTLCDYFKKRCQWFTADKLNTCMWVLKVVLYTKHTASVVWEPPS